MQISREIAGDDVDAQHAGSRERDGDRYAENERKNQHQKRNRDHVVFQQPRTACTAMREVLLP